MKPDSQLANTLRALRAAGSQGCTGHELYLAGGGHRYSARADDLRALGYDIPDATYEGKTAGGKSIYRFVLQGEPSVSSGAGTTGPLSDRQPPGMAFVRPVPEGTGGTLFDLDPTEERRSAITGKPLEGREAA